MCGFRGMCGFRAVLFVLAVSVSVVFVILPGRAQVPNRSPLDLIMGLGLPAVDTGVVSDPSRVPGGPEAYVRRALETASTRHDLVGEGGARYVPGRVIVKFRDGVSSASRLSALNASSGTASMSPRPEFANFDLVRIDQSEDPAVVARMLAVRAEVEYAQPAHRVHTEFVPNDPLYKQYQWNLPLIGMEQAWDIQPQAGSSIIVAVIDTGMAFSNATLTATLPAFSLDGVRYPALGPVTIPYAGAPQLGAGARFVAPYDFLFNNKNPLDFEGHGTHVSGTIGQLTNDGIGTAGVAFGVRLMPIKVLASLWDVLLGGSSDVGGTDDDVARGIRYAADNGAKIINLSLGGPGPSGSSPVMEDAINYAVGKGVFIAIAAGNDFENGNPVEQPAEIASRVQGAVSVAAVDPASNHAHYSSSGTWVELAAPGGTDQGFSPPAYGYVWQQTFNFKYTDTFMSPPDQFVAPRFDVLAYVGYTGTSMAAPHVAALAAMLMQQGITSPAAIEAALEKFATHLGDPGRNRLYGYGLVDARKTLLGLGLAR
jgi:serine protease